MSGPWRANGGLPRGWMAAITSHLYFVDRDGKLRKQKAVTARDLYIAHVKCFFAFSEAVSLLKIPARGFRGMNPNSTGSKF